MDLKSQYLSLLNSAYMTVDLKGNMPSPLRLYETILVCKDGTEVELVLVKDEGEYYFWVRYSRQYFELYLCPEPNDFYGWKKAMISVEADAVEIMQRIVDGGKEYLENMIRTEGIFLEYSFIITEKRLANNIKLPVSCAIVAYGQVFHGVKELEEYCATQVANSRPYILKRSLAYSFMDECCETDIRFCRNYLICDSVESAMIWMRDFIVLDKKSALDPEEIWMSDEHHPPLVCYADGYRYMVLSYRQ